MRTSQVLPAGTWDAARAVDRVLVDFDRRHRRRIVLQTESGREVLLDLPQAVRLREGDGLETEGGVVRVCARPEPLLEIHAPDGAALARIAWHLGNRHLPVQFAGARCVRIRADHVIADMVRRLGGHVHALEAPFDPEAGAYAGGHAHAHHPDHDRHHDHDHHGE